MKGYNLEDTMNMHNLNRSPYRNMPEKCLKCAYACKPSTFGATCCMCSGKYANKTQK